MKNNQGVVICLILFIILTLGLGTTTYFGFKSLSEQRAERETARGEVENVKSETEKLASEYSAFKEKLGYADGSNASDIVKQMKRDVASALASARSLEVVNGASIKYETPEGEDESALPNTTFKDALATLKTNLDALAKDVSTLSSERDAQIRNAFASVETSNRQQTTFTSDVTSAQAAQKENLDNARAAYNKLTSSFVDQTKSFDKTRVEAKDAIDEATTETAARREAADRYAEINLDLSRRIDELENADFFVPDGAVLYADQFQRTVRLSVGSKDGVRPLMKFNVFPYDFLETRGGGAKGVVEVVQTLDEISCEAKIVADSNEDPIRPGDIIYTSLWRPGEVEQYAFDCRLDINEDGVSDLQELVNLVESKGLRVAAYVDDRGKVFGKITPETTRLIVPNHPLKDALDADDSLDDETKERLLAAETEVREAASANGVREMKLSDFLVRMDYIYTDVIYNSGDIKNPAESASVGSEPVAPVYYNGLRVDSVSAGVPTNPQATTVKESAPTFRRRAPK